MKQYLLSVHMVDGAPPPPAETMERMYRDVDAVNRELKAANAFVFAGGLDPVNTTTVVRIENDAVVTADGPFVEGPVQIGGFWVIAAPDPDAASAWAAKATRACGAPVEVRPFQDEPEA